MQVEIYTKPSCSYCFKAKELMANKNIVYTEYKLNEDFTREVLLEKYPTIKTYPVIVIDGMMIGGYEQFKTMVLLEEQRTGTMKFLAENT